MLHGLFQQAFASRIELTVLSNVAHAHSGIV